MMLNNNPSSLVHSSQSHPRALRPQTAIKGRPQTAGYPAVQSEPLLARPSTAPATSIVSPRQQEKYGGITWSEIKMPPVNVGIEEVKSTFCFHTLLNQHPTGI